MEEDDAGLVFIDLAAHAPDDEFAAYFDASGFVGPSDSSQDTSSVVSTDSSESDDSLYLQAVAAVQVSDAPISDTVSTCSDTDDDDRSMFSDAEDLFPDAPFDDAPVSGDPDPKVDVPYAVNAHEFDDYLDELEAFDSSVLEPVQMALHALDAHLHATGQTRTEYYRHRAQESSTPTDSAHIDGGAMASTTHRKELLAHYRPITNPQTVLRVADDSPHHPIGEGYLKVPSPTAPTGYILVKTFHTPTLPTTIVSPYATGRQHHCHGYTTVTNFDGSNCSIRLRHSRRSAEDILLPVHLRQGLLYSSPLLIPSTSEHESSRPSSVLRIREITTDDSTSIPCGCCSGSGTSPSVPEPSMFTCQVCGSGDTTFGSDNNSAGEGPDPSAANVPDPSVGEGLQPPPPSSLLDPDPRSFQLCHLSRDQLRILWHQRLGHIHSRRVGRMHNFARGVPRVSIGDDLDQCPICSRAKLRTAAHGTDSTSTATRCNQGISVDFGFMVQRSSDTDRMHRLQGLNGETCYCLIVDHFSGMCYGETFRSKAPPIDFCSRWLARFGLGNDVANKYVCFDLGGELGHCTEIVDLFAKAGYHHHPTSSQSSHQNALGERPHQTISNAIRAMLGGAALPPKFWPYAFHHFLRLSNLTIHEGRTATPFELCLGRPPNLRLLRTFGCRVYAQPTRPRRAAKLESDTRCGTFLGYSASMKNILYFDPITETVKDCRSMIFDESEHELEYSQRSPNARMLADVKTRRPVAIDAATVVPNLDVTTSAFTTFKTVRLPYDSTADEFPLGFELSQCARLRRAFISRLRQAPVGQSLRTARRDLHGAYLVSLDGTPIFTQSDVDRVLQRLSNAAPPPTHVEIVYAPERRAAFDDRTGPLHLRLNDLRRIAALQHVPGEGLTSRDYTAAIQDYLDDLHDHGLWRAAERVHLSRDEFLMEVDIPTSAEVHRLQADAMTDEERKLTSFNRRKLQRLSNWDDWDAAFDKQLDAHHEAGTFGAPVPRPTSSPDGGPLNILRIVWSNVVKTNGKRKARSCLDGSKRAAPWLRDYGTTYASCIEHPCMKMFFALAASQGLVVTTADTSNAFQQSPPPTRQCYLEIDDAYRSWYQKRFGKDIDPRRFVIPLHKALQGHPEAGALWEGMITKILTANGFTPTTHERNLYRGELDGALVLVCRMVDDFAIATQVPATATKLVEIINSHVTTTCEGLGQTTSEGMYCRYNGLDVHQTADYIQLSAVTYIERMLQTHGWETPNAKVSDHAKLTPLAVDLPDQLAGLNGPTEGSAEHAALEKQVGFGYRQVMGELIYAYVLCRVDIAYAVTFMSRFAQAPAAEHYQALKGICRYLRATKDWGIRYRRAQRCAYDLPKIAELTPTVEAELPEFPSHAHDQLVGYVDAAHATDLKTRRSVTGYVFTMAGGAIAYKSKLQPTVATSSTEAEFCAAVVAAKVAKYLRSVLKELGYAQSTPTPLYEDNQAAIAMINERRPTPRSRHIDIQYYAIQEWRQQGEIQMIYIPTVINPADDATKALGWVLHHRHTRRILGHHAQITA